MSQENVELVRSVYRPGDPSRFFDLLAEEIEFDMAAATLAPDYPGIIHGKGAVIDFWRDYLGMWDEYVLEPIKIIDAGDDQVVVVVDERGQGRGSGASFKRRVGLIITIRAGSFVRLVFFMTGEEALEAAGLSE